jgi:predicted DNA binding CopG/RHH family protein
MKGTKAKPERSGANKTKRAKPVPVVELHGVPEFKNEAEEADWWDAHPEVVTKAFEQAYGKVPSKRRPPTRIVNIRLPVEDIARAQRIAARKGFGYQTLVKSLLHEALEREERA